MLDEFAKCVMFVDLIGLCLVYFDFALCCGAMICFRLLPFRCVPQGQHAGCAMRREDESSLPV